MLVAVTESSLRRLLAGAHAASEAVRRPEPVTWVQGNRAAS